MRRSIFGFEDWLYGVLALVLAVFHQPGLIVVLLIFLVVAERDGWLNRQVTQALLLYFGCALGAMLLRMVFSALVLMAGTRTPRP